MPRKIISANQIIDWTEDDKLEFVTLLAQNLPTMSRSKSLERAYYQIQDNHLTDARIRKMVADIMYIHKDAGPNRELFREKILEHFTQ